MKTLYESLLKNVTNGLGGVATEDIVQLRDNLFDILNEWMNKKGPTASWPDLYYQYDDPEFGLEDNITHGTWDRWTRSMKIATQKLSKLLKQYSTLSVKMIQDKKNWTFSIEISSNNIWIPLVTIGMRLHLFNDSHHKWEALVETCNLYSDDLYSHAIHKV